MSESIRTTNIIFPPPTKYDEGDYWSEKQIELKCNFDEIFKFSTITSHGLLKK
jgi:hypothetical protein